MAEIMKGGIPFQYTRAKRQGPRCIWQPFEGSDFTDAVNGRLQPLRRSSSACHRSYACSISCCNS